MGWFWAGLGLVLGWFWAGLGDWFRVGLGLVEVGLGLAYGGLRACFWAGLGGLGLG